MALALGRAPITSVTGVESFQRIFTQDGLVPGRVEV